MKDFNIDKVTSRIVEQAGSPAPGLAVVLATIRDLLLIPDSGVICSPEAIQRKLKENG